jgi:hypothetical protein
MKNVARKVHQKKLRGEKAWRYLMNVQAFFAVSCVISYKDF